MPRVFARDLLSLKLWVTAALTATIWLLPTQAAGQAIYGSLTGTITDTSSAAVPGATVAIKNEDTGLELTGMTDSSGTYTIRNITGGTYTLKASLQGFKEFVQTGILITAGGIIRINGRLEIGTLSEAVTVTSEATVLKTDKADVSVDLRPEDVTNLPLNQYRNYQYLLNLVPGATPPVFQNAQTDTPGRALSSNINGTNRNNNVTRIDGAASINVWLPHHAGYIAPAETIENVNISTNSFDASQGMTGGAATAVQTKSGTNTVRGSAFYFRQQDELNARRGYFDPSKVDASTAIMGGTVGGPIRKNRLFYFGGWERNAERQGIFNTYTVPTARMRNGDFSEVLALNSSFRIYDPATGTSDGRNRTFFDNAVIPANRVSEIAKKIQAMYPEPNNAGTNNGLQNNLFLPRNPTADRDNYDVKVNWNRTSSHQIWAKFSMMQASVFDLFYLPFEAAGGGDTRTTVYTVGQTWTLTPTLLLDGSIGANVMKQSMTGPDYGTDYGTEVFGIPGLNADGVGGPGSADLERYSGMPVFSTGLSQLGNDSTWTPVWRDERSYTISTNLTKVSGRHEFRTGFDFVRLRLNHWQPEVGNPRGVLTFGGGITGTPGYAGVGGWNGYASFLLGEMSQFGKSEQFEELSGRENQYGVYVADRWQVNEKLTLNLGLRYEYYPLMMRQDRGIELLDVDTFIVRLGGVGGNDDHLGIKVSNTLFAPRLGAAYRLTDKTVFRAGYGKTFTPLPWSRPMRGRFPLTIAHGDAGVNGFTPYGNVSKGIPGAPNPDISTGNVPLPRGVDMTSPDPNDVDARRHPVVERVHRAPLPDGYRGEHRLRWHSDRRAVRDQRLELRGVRRQRQSYVVHAGGHCRHQHPRLHGAHALQRAAGGHKSPLQERAPAQGRVHVEQGDERSRGRRWRLYVGPAVAVQPQLRARQRRSSPHAAGGLRVRAAVWAGQLRCCGEHHQRLADQRHRVVAVRTAIHRRGRQRAVAAAGRLTDDQRDRKPPAGLRRGGT